VWEGQLVERTGRFGPFVACSRYPECKYAPTSARTASSEKGRKCWTSPAPSAASRSVERRGRYGMFKSCSDIRSAGPEGRQEGRSRLVNGSGAAVFRAETLMVGRLEFQLRMRRGALCLAIAVLTLSCGTGSTSGDDQPYALGSSASAAASPARLRPPPAERQLSASFCQREHCS